MGEWKRVLLSGSNFHVNALTASEVSNIGDISLGTIPENQRKVVTTRFLPGDDGNPDQNKFFTTGSYGSAGPSGDTNPFFPASTNVILLAQDTSIGTGRIIRLRAQPPGVTNLPSDGKAAINFYTSGSAVGLDDATGFTLQIARNGGLGANTEITHKGTENFKIQLSESFEVSETSFTRPNAFFPPPLNSPFFPSNEGFGSTFNNLTNLFSTQTGDATNSNSLGFIGGDDFAILLANYQFSSVEPNAEILGLEMKYSRKTSSPLYQVGWFINNKTSEVDKDVEEYSNGGNSFSGFNDVITSRVSSLKTDNITQTGFFTKTIGGPTDNWDIGQGNPGSITRFRDINFGLFTGITSAVPCAFIVMRCFSNSATLTIEGTDSGDGSPALKIHHRIPVSNFIVNAFDDDQLDETSENIIVRTDGIIFKPRLQNINTTSQLVYAQQGQLALNSGVDFGGSSKRIKKNIKDLDPKIIENFNKLRPVSFNYHSTPDKINLGFIAEEVAKINPLLAKFGPDYALTLDKKINHNAPLLSDKKVPLNIDSRAILALSVAKLQQLEKELNNI